jgi:uncharacterized membrane protein YccC
MRRPSPTAGTSGLRRGHPNLGVRGLPTAEDLRQAVRMALACGVAWGLGGLLGARHPTFAALGVVFGLQDNTAGSLRTVGQRLLGVGGGVAIGLLALHGPGLSAPVVAVLMLIALLAGAALRFGPQLNVQVAVSALLLLAGGGGWRYGLQRLWETALGGAVAIAVSMLLWPADPEAASQAEVARLQARLAGDLRAAPAVFALVRRRASAYLRRVRASARDAERAASEAQERLEALRWNPWRDRIPLERLAARARCLSVLYGHARALARLAADCAADPSSGAPPADALRDALEALAAASAALAGGQAGEALARLDQARSGADALLAPGARPPIAPAVASVLRHLESDLRSLLLRARGGG